MRRHSETGARATSRPDRPPRLADTRSASRRTFDVQRRIVVLPAQPGHQLLAGDDDGPGVPAELGERVFDPGVRDDADGDGAGLGLALARRLACSCGGDVRLGPGPGGCFVLSLPIVRD